MKKTKILVLIVAVLLAISVVSLMGCGLFKSIKYDEVKANLENAGYKVTVLTGAEYVALPDAYPSIMASELVKYVYAEKGNDVIKLYFFQTIDIASYNEDFMFDVDLPVSGQNNEVVYRATKQAKKDAKI